MQAAEHEVLEAVAIDVACRGHGITQPTAGERGAVKLHHTAGHGRRDINSRSEGTGMAIDDVGGAWKDIAGGSRSAKNDVRIAVAVDVGHRHGAPGMIHAVDCDDA